MKNEYLLVVQLPTSVFAEFDSILKLEESIAREIGSLGEVDGHDVGLGEVNIFVLTQVPHEAFQRIRNLTDREGLSRDLKAAFRAIDSDEYSILYPPGLLQFGVK